MSGLGNRPINRISLNAKVLLKTLDVGTSVPKIKTVTDWQAKLPVYSSMALIVAGYTVALPDAASSRHARQG